MLRLMILAALALAGGPAWAGGVPVLEDPPTSAADPAGLPALGPATFPSLSGDPLPTPDLAPKADAGAYTAIPDVSRFTLSGTVFGKPRN